MDDRYDIGLGYVTRLNLKRGRLIEKVEALLDKARERYGEANFSGATAALRSIQRLIEKELPKRKARK